MLCRRCNSSNVTIQNVYTQKRKGRGWKYWLLFGWFLDILSWIFFTLPRLIIGLLMPKRTKLKHHKEATCQQCSYSWKV